MAINTKIPSRCGPSLVAAAVLVALCTPVLAQTIKDAYGEFEGGPLFIPNARETFGPGLPSGFGAPSLKLPTEYAGASVGLSFKGVNQYDLRNLLGGSFIPPDTNGAIGATQYMITTNGVYGIYNKTTGAAQLVTAANFWTAAGGGGQNGDARILFDKPSQRWVALQFGTSVADIQIAVSNTSDATGSWKSTKFTGFAGGTADYPTLAIDSQAVYIGTNNFNSASAYSGTTLNVIARSDLLGAGAPSTASLKQFVTPYSSAVGAVNYDSGYAIQGVNSTGPVAGRVLAAAGFANDSLRYNISNPGTAGATQGSNTLLGLDNYGASQPGRQPDGTRNIDTFDERIGSSVWEKNGKIYAVYNATAAGKSNTEVRWMVLNATTNAVIQQGTISDPKYDYFQGSLSVNDSGQVVIGYNRTGPNAVDGNVTLMARTYNPDASGALLQTNEISLKVSPISDYHNGSAQGAAAVGRQRWGDYSSVTVDPSDPQSFWVVGQYAEVWNNAAGCGVANPAIAGCTLGGGSSWGTWVSQINVAAVPEVSTYAMMICGLLAMGALSRRRSTKF